ncbi:isocitrate lyase/phosphoenolpyruvate mutase family protein [Nitratireductor sp. XY-223]|uniref:isocitrate lyase/PEP mutase family protein n=1 Tax=Nitratireductor sp. XY-223 TaxID=2561926 RepID=UPI0010AB0A9C|nr:isocitrate lyase/phosphoenolpyruvate mutase family protein [Nitratireductor sp. XY-223]
METHRKFETFKGLHERDGAFVIPNPWNAGSAVILESLGFDALATTSAGLAFAKGRCDGAAEITRDSALENAREIVEATHLPVSADLEGGFGDRPEDCAETIALASGTGLMGGSIEDATGSPGVPIYDFSQAVERIAAAAEAARGLPFLLTARAENFLYGRPDLDDTIRRLQAYEEAGADVLYAPGLPDLEAIRLVCRSVTKPVNVVMGLSGPTWSVAQLAEAGVKRISVGGSFARAALGGFIRAANEVRERGTFTYVVEALPDAEARRLMESRRR